MTDGGEKKDDDRIAEQAAGWIARLQSSDATDADRRDFEVWRGQNSAHGEAYEDLSALWGELRDIPQPAAPTRRKTRPSRAAVGNALGLFVIAGLSLTLYQMGILDRLRADYYTTVGEVRQVTLDDGTVVNLNTDTAIAVAYTPGARKITLLRGEAFFDVAHNANRPFIVSDGRMSAEALGTHFGMETASASLEREVEVEEGRVAVTSGEEKAILQSGDTATLQSGKLVIGRENVVEATAWRDGKLIFSGQPLGAVLKTLERYRRGRILALDDRAANRLVSGVFDLRDTDQALDVIAGSLPVSVTRLTGLMVIIRSKD